MIKYFKTLWENNITPVNGRNLNKIEDALEYLYDVIRNVPSEENIRIANEKQRQSNETTRSNSEIKRNAIFDSKIKDVDKAINASNENIVEVNNKFESITASKQQDAEVIIARDGEESLNNRLKRDLYIDNIPLKQKVLDIEGLKEMQDLEYETDNGYKICKNTKNGVVKDLKIYGKSLVNKVNSNRISTARQNDLLTEKLTDKSLTNCTCYAYNLNSKTIRLGIYSIDSETYIRGVALSKKETKIDIGVNEYISVSSANYSDGWTSGDLNTFKNSVVILDSSNNYINDYFEGIASVGNGNEIEVLSMNNGNLIDSNNIIKGKYLSVNGKQNPHDNSFICDYFINIQSNMKIRNNQNCIYNYFNKNKEYISGEEVTSNKYATIPNDAVFMKIGLYNRLDIISSIYVGMSENDTYIPYKQDKKPILFKDTDGAWKPVTELRGIDLNSCDTIEKHSDGKHYLHVRTEKTVLNGDVGENWQLYSQSLEDYLCFYIELTSCKPKSDLICDKLENVQAIYLENIVKEGICIHPTLTRTYVKILKSKLSQQNLEGFKAWLQSNNVSFIYQLAEEKVYEVSPLDLESYDNETMISLGTGAISPHASFKITSSITNFVKNVQERVTRVENYIYKANMANFAVALSTLDTKLRLDKLEAPK